MARPLRIEYPGAFYHVMNRGNQRRDVFHSTIDCETFLEKLDLYSDRYHVNVHCYCLMTNHFHLLLGTPEANLSKFMQVFLNSFTMTINRRGYAPATSPHRLPRLRLQRGLRELLQLAHRRRRK